MPFIEVTTRDGTTHSVPAKKGVSLMHNLKDGGIDEIEALCGGCCSCATCHVYVDEAWLGRLPRQGGDERGLVELSPHYRKNSRLSCQVTFDPALDGIKVTVAPQD